jgi:hypothetical protein
VVEEVADFEAEAVVASEVLAEADLEAEEVAEVGRFICTRRREKRQMKEYK